MTATPAPLLTREKAAAYLRERGLEHMTKKRLEFLSWRGGGPSYSRLGKRVYYTHEQLDTWLKGVLRPVNPADAKPA
jgi:hypothetical protein